MIIILVLCGAIELSFHWKKTKMCYVLVLIQDIKYTFGFNLKWRLRFVICVSLSLFFFLLFFGLACNSWLVNCEQCTVHYSWVLQIILFSNFFIKNTFHNIIYTFKNYFATVFSISAKISLIQTDPKKYWIFLIVLYVIYLFF